MLALESFPPGCKEPEKTRETKRKKNKKKQTDSGFLPAEVHQAT